MACKSHVPVLTIVFASAVVLGCSDSAPAPPVVEVTGRVFVGDEPLRFGQVVFQPLGGGQPAIGKLEPNGKFTLGTYGESDGATIGRHRVRIVSYALQDPENKDIDPKSESLGDLTIPERYSSFATSGIEVSVLRQGNSPFIFKLQSEPVDQGLDTAADQGPEASSEEELELMSDIDDGSVDPN